VLSVLICTHRRVERLRATLENLRRMKPPPGPWELLVLDNASRDGTDEAVAAFARTAPFTVRYVFEPRLGLSIARNRAIAEAAGDILAFTDDDCIVDADWACRIVEEFARDPGLLMLGGRVELFDPLDAPLAIRTSRERRELSGDVANYEHMIGANMAFRRTVVEQVGGFDIRMGGGSGVVSSGEDSEFYFRVLRLPGRVVYAPDVLVHHHHGRRAGEMLRRSQEYAQGRGAVLAKHTLRGDRVALRLLWWETAALLRLRFTSVATDEERAGAAAALRALLVGAGAFVRNALRPSEL
jgi:glycosyltransferase involved in cell wall biosynthesis